MWIPPRPTLAYHNHTVNGCGFVAWFTGLPGAGKSTVAALVADQLEEEGFLLDRLDGDLVRAQLWGELGFSRTDRDAQVARVAWIASRIARAGAIVLVSAISPYADARQRARQVVEEHARFVEIFVSTPLEECMRRDPKGHYARALAGDIEAFTGVSDPYEAPTAADIVVDTIGVDPAAAAEIVIAGLRDLDLLSVADRAVQ
jgi:adenylyl-sulfate kinase